MVEEISPASIPTKPIINWSESIKASSSTIEDGGDTVNFGSSGGFRYCRSEQEFESGNGRFEIKVDFGGKDAQVSYGICFEKDLKCDAGVYYFTNAYIYCNYYPSFTKHYNNIHKTTPKKCTDGALIAINFDFDSKKLFWEIDGTPYEELDFESDGKPVYVVVGMFSGKATFV